MKKLFIGLALLAAVYVSSCKKDKEPQTFSYTLNQQASTAVWKGFLKTGYFNEGSVQVKSSGLKVKNGVVIGGTFNMPLSTLDNFNLPTAELKEMLIHHLKSADFFSMALYPQLSFTIKNVKPYTGGQTIAIAGANYTVAGAFTMLGKPIEISFPAKIDIKDDKIVIGALLKIDRTKWGMNYATAPELADDEFIMPEVDITLDLQGTIED